MYRSNCPACLSSKKRKKYIIDCYSISQCKECKSLFAENLPNEEKLKELYKSGNYYFLPPDSIKRIKLENERRIKNIHELNIFGKVLDVGCAKGLFLDAIKNNKYETYGIELSAANVEECLKNGHKVFHGDLNLYYSSEVGKNKFNVITCLDVIEHIEQPIDFMKKLRVLLDEKGILILSTPNFSGIISKILRHKNPFLTPPEHLNFFSKKGLRKLISNNGFKIIHEETFGYITDAGLERTINKYLPRFLSPFSFLLKPFINYTTKLFNSVSAGLELEFYLRKC